MIKSHLQAALLQRVFRHVHVSSTTGITMEFSFVGIRGCRDDSQSDALESRISVWWNQNQPGSLMISADFLTKPRIPALDTSIETRSEYMTPSRPTFADGGHLKWRARSEAKRHDYPGAQPSLRRSDPSQADIQMTKAIVDIATPLGISVHNHII